MSQLGRGAVPFRKPWHIDGCVLIFSEAECEGHWTALRVGNLAWCSSQNEVAFVRAGPLLYGVELRSALSNKLLELFDIGYDGDPEIHLKFTHGGPGIQHQ